MNLWLSAAKLLKVAVDPLHLKSARLPPNKYLYAHNSLLPAATKIKTTTVTTRTPTTTTTRTTKTTATA